MPSETRMNVAHVDLPKMASPIVTVQEGKLRGKYSQDYLSGTGTYYSFLGIPYGRPPIGELRFKAPQPAEPWQGIRDATLEGPECPSNHLIFTYYVGAENNCLNLNVFTKKLPQDSSSLKPVMVWIHGGGFVYGSNKTELYGPDYLIKEDIVLVSINYRLGVLGFLSLEDPSLEVPGNAGMKDMILALQWIQNNIKNFSGDPNNVTIFGESAGAASVHYLYLSPRSKGLFHKAIAQSGTAFNCWARGSSNGSIIAANLGYGEKDERKILEYLRKLPPRKLVDAQHKNPDPFDCGTKRPFGPVIEKYTSESAFMTEEPAEIIKAAKFQHVPLIMGYTSREGIATEACARWQLMMGFNVKIDLEREILGNLEVGSQHSVETAAKVKKYYFEDEELSAKNVDKLYLLKTDNLFLYGIYESISSQKLVSKAPIYYYTITLDTSMNLFKKICLTKYVYVSGALCYLISKLGDGSLKDMLLKLFNSLPQNVQDGTCHGDDLFYLFKTFLNEKLQPGSMEEIYVKRIVRLWTNFAKNGNPTPNEDDTLLNIRWDPVNKEKNLLLNIGSTLRMEVEPDSERLQFWDNICKQPES